MSTRSVEAPVQRLPVFAGLQSFVIDRLRFYIDRYKHVNHESYAREFIATMRDLPINLKGFAISRLTVRYGKEFVEGEQAAVFTTFCEPDSEHKEFEQWMVTPGVKTSVSQKTIWVPEGQPNIPDIRGKYLKDDKTPTRESPFIVPGSGMLDYPDYSLILENERIAALADLGITLETLRTDHKSLVFLSDLDTSFGTLLSAGEIANISTEIHLDKRSKIIFVQEMIGSSPERRVSQVSICRLVNDETRVPKPIPRNLLSKLVKQGNKTRQSNAPL